MTSLVLGFSPTYCAQRREAGIAVPQQRAQPMRAHHHFVQHARGGAEFAAEPGVSFARTRGAHRHVDGERERLDAGGFRATHEVVADFMFAMCEAIELQPEHVRRNFGDLFDRRAAGDAERVRHAHALRGGREQFIGGRPDQRRPPHRRNADRRGIAAAEQITSVGGSELISP